MPLRFGKFKPNYPALILVAVYGVAFLIYMIGYVRFASSYQENSDEENAKSLEAMKWFFVGCPIVILLTQILLFVVGSFESRQILIGVRDY